MPAVLDGDSLLLRPQIASWQPPNQAHMLNILKFRWCTYMLYISYPTRGSAAVVGRNLARGSI